MRDLFVNHKGEVEKPNQLLRVAIYARKSNESEGRRSKSITEQIEFCSSICQSYGFSEENVRIYAEEEGQKGEHYWKDAAGKNPSPYRPQLTALMTDVAAGKVDVIMVWRSDRLIRDAGVGDALARELLRHNVKLMCGTRDVELHTSSGFYQFSVEAASNRRYRDQISEDTKRDQEYKIMRGLFTRDPTCFGFRSAGNQKAEPQLHELELVNRIFRLFVLGENGEGPLTSNGIARLLMKEGISLAVGCKGQKPTEPIRVNTTTIRNILNQPMYIGRFRHKQHEYECKALLVPARDGSGKMETAVPVALYEAAQIKLKLSAHSIERKGLHLLSGVVICAYCGRRLYVVSTVPPRYRCENARPPGYCKRGVTRNVRETMLDEWVVKELAPLIKLEIENLRLSAGRDADVQALAAIVAEIQELKKKETNILRELIELLDNDQLGRIAAKLRVEREQLQRREADMRKRVEANNRMPDISAAAIASLSKSALRDTLLRCVQWIAVSRDYIVVLTTLGTYISARITSVKHTFASRNARIHIGVPTVDDTLRCIQWLPSLSDFIKGRRHYLADDLSDEELLPGITSLLSSKKNDSEVELNIEEIQLAS